MLCSGCHRPIVEGQHYMKVRIELATNFPPNLVMAHVDPTVLEAVVHHPSCLAAWCSEDEIIKDVFLR